MAAASILYWLRPGPGWRRDLDVFLGIGGLLPNAWAGLWLDGLPNVVGWSSVLLGVYCFHRSWRDSSFAGNTHWALWHVGAHHALGVAALAMASGGAEARVGDSPPPLNLLAGACLALIGVGGALRCLGGAEPPS
jgi:hypothetical protein